MVGWASQKKPGHNYCAADQKKQQQQKKNNAITEKQGRQHQKMAGVIRLPVLGKNQTLQMYGKFDGFPLSQRIWVVCPKISGFPRNQSYDLGDGMFRPSILRWFQATVERFDPILKRWATFAGALAGLNPCGIQVVK